ncbi:MAG TPA: hypothetical protein VNO81_10385, partial [Candidatus Nitrosotenuis sp.]|nr:hypothetical protein [Candidatus Nitrosotenuis sp.]
LIATLYPQASNDQIKARLLGGADPLPELAGKMVSGGRLNAANALENDSTPPAAACGFAVSEARATSVTLSWTAPGDDGWQGQASAYDLRVADRPIVDGPAGQDQTSFDEARPVYAGAPAAAGSAESVTVPLIPSGQERQLYFALKVRDNVGNASPLSTAQARVPAAAVAFEDNQDSGPGNWTAEAGWTRVEEPGRGQVWSDSAGEYGNDENRSLTSRPISLANLTGSVLLLDCRYDLENRYDQVLVEVSGDGQNWTEVGRFTGASEWGTHSFDLSAYDGQEVRVRFRLQTDSSVTRDGFYLDNVVIMGSPRRGLRTSIRIPQGIPGQG